jgi:hypothetical protein
MLAGEEKIPQGLKPHPDRALFGTTEVVTFHKTRRIAQVRNRSVQQVSEPFPKRQV